MGPGMVPGLDWLLQSRISGALIRVATSMHSVLLFHEGTSAIENSPWLFKPWSAELWAVDRRLGLLSRGVLENILLGNGLKDLASLDSWC